ncbi:hypothetical protein [Pararhodobacter sp. SW119]|uniref:hypothetical protein n=1 Tax=Pararhodobacter sp. SW119 TaxID=2780075 RepID=UPI001ADFD1EF|nr:hypothetical protein [Pararhodobacter sp. SW119]
MLTDDKIARFDSAHCRPGLRLRANRMLRALLDEDAADRWASHVVEDRDSIAPDDLASLVPPPRDMWRVDDAELAPMLQDFAVMGVFAIQTGQFDDRSLLEPLMDLQSAACTLASRCDAGGSATVIPFQTRDPATLPTRGTPMPRVL